MLRKATLFLPATTVLSRLKLAVAKRNISHRVIGKAMLGVSLEIVEYPTRSNVTSAEILMVVCFGKSTHRILPSLRS
jgi:hypothetical protein